MTAALRSLLDQLLAPAITLDREIAARPRARVYRGVDRATNQAVAVKVFFDDPVADGDALRFTREIEIASQLHHPGVVPILRWAREGRFIYFVMPFMEGGSLRDLLDREGPQSLERTRQIASDVSAALRHAHDHNVVHRDIKPGNILLDESGRAYIADLGIARLIERSPDADGITSTGVAMGTPAYMSPEQVGADRRLDGRADQYALACVVFELLTGAPPFMGAAPQDVLARHLREAPPSVRAVHPELPVSVDAAIRRALAKSRAERFPSVDAFARALASHAPARPAIAWASLARGARAQRRWLAVAGVMALGALGFVRYRNTTAPVPCRLAFVTQPAPSIAHAVLNPPPRVAVHDCAGQTIATAKTRISIAATGTAGLGGTTTVTATNGVAEFGNLVSMARGSGVKLVAIAVDDSTLAPAASGIFAVSGPPVGMRLLDTMPTVVPGVPLSGVLRVQLIDADGNEVRSASATNPVTVSSSIGMGARHATGLVMEPFSEAVAEPGQAGYPLARTGTTVGPTVRAVSGVATFSLSGFRQRVASGDISRLLFSSDGLSGAAVGWTQARGPATQLVWHGNGPSPDGVLGSGVRAGAQLPVIEVAVADSIGNEWVKPIEASVRLRLSSPSGATLVGGLELPLLPCSSTYCARWDGKVPDATVAVRESGSGAVLVAESPRLQPTQSRPFDVGAPSPAVRIAFAQQPSDVSSGQPIVPAVVVQVLDAQGKVVAVGSHTVSLELGMHRADGSIWGIPTRTTKGGAVSFDAVTVTGAAGKYTLVAKGAGLAQAVSRPFTLRP